MAMAEAYLAARYNRPGFEIVNHFTYAIVSDGDLMEGVAAEAASLAGHLQLGKLIYLYDDNHVSLPPAPTSPSPRIGAALRSVWLAHAIARRRQRPGGDRAGAARRTRETTRPSLILVRTHLGYGSPHKQDTFEAHGSPLGVEEVRLTKQNLGWPTEPPFLRSEPVRAHFREAVERGEQAEAEWNDRFSAYAQSLSRTRAGTAAAHRAANCRPAGMRTFPSFPSRRQGHGHPRRLGQGDERHRAAPAGADRRLGRSGSIDAHRTEGAGRL